MEDRSQEQRELIVFKKTTVRLDHLIEHYSVQLQLNWLCVSCSSRPSCLKAGDAIHRMYCIAIPWIKNVDKTNYAIHCLIR